MSRNILCDSCRDVIEEEQTKSFEYKSDVGALNIVLVDSMDWCQVCSKRALNRIARQVVEQLTEHRKVKP